MSDTALNAMKRTALVLFCLVLLATLTMVFTRVVAARVPEQRATLEKLITDRTGLAVRFDNVHLAWGLDGTSAVFTRVELTDPKAGRVRVVAPELRVEFDTWDFLRHQQFSLGHVTVSSPDIEIVEPEDVVAAAIPAPKKKAAGGVAAPVPAADEAAMVRRATSWALLMPNGRIEVEGARVHLRRQGESAKTQTASFTLSQAIISRGPTSFNAYGTMLLSQDVGQSLFVSAKFDNLAPRSRVSGELRVIARRVFLEKLRMPGLRGRGTLDAKITLANGLVAGGTWTANARELAFGDDGARFDHVTFGGTLSRDHGDLLLDFSDVQLTRGARLERAPKLAARLSLEPGTTRIARTTVDAARLPFMAAELAAGVLAPQLADALPESRGGWGATAGELHDVHFDSGKRRRHPDAWAFSARMENAELTRATDQSRLTQLAARVTIDARAVSLEFDPQVAATLRLGAIAEPRPLTLAGTLGVSRGIAGAAADGTTLALRFGDLRITSGATTLAANGAWDDAARTVPLDVALANVDRALMADAWRLANDDAPEPALLTGLAAANITEGRVALLPMRDAGALVADWSRSRGTLKLDALASAGDDDARLTDGRGTLAFARGAAQLRLTQGKIEDFTLTTARIDWPAKGAPRLTASLGGLLESPLLAKTLATQGLAGLKGQVMLDAEARGDREMRSPDAWRVTARLADASVPLGRGVPPLEKLAGTLRYADGQLRGLSLDGTWLGGPVEIESRRSPRAQLTLALNGTADAAPVLGLWSDAPVTGKVAGQLAWSGTALRAEADAPWRLALASNLVGVQSDLPAPFDKARARALPVEAELRLEGDGIREFSVAGRDVSVRGELQAGALRVHFELPGVEGDLRRAAAAGAKSDLSIDHLETRRAPAALAAAAAMLPANGVLSLNVADLRQADRSLGALRADVTRTASGVAFSFESAEPALHRLSAQGTCDEGKARCRADFTADTAHLASLLHGVSLPAQLPAERLRASGELSWPLSAEDLTTVIDGHFDVETEGHDSTHQLVANAVLANGQIQLENVQGTGPDADQVFRGSGRVGLVERDYDFTVDYERITVAAAAVPTPARARLARAWNALRGSAARRGWAEAPETKRVQLHGYWD
ncbi:MAG TPA: hypothetical protein VMF52_06945 [Steroidobacteraceae bacterium]|nr:hypothetical protein [Steroidobacteraceae bacterium]